MSLIYFILTLRAIRRLQINLLATLRSCRLIAYACLDLLIAGLYIAILTVLSAGGLPANCYGLTRQNWNPGDAPNDPSPGYTTIRFGPGVAGQHGELDNLCPLGMASFGLGVLVMLVFTSPYRTVFLQITYDSRADSFSSSRYSSPASSSFSLVKLAAWSSLRRALKRTRHSRESSNLPE